MDYLSEPLHWALFSLLLVSSAYHILCIRGLAVLPRRKKENTDFSPSVSVLKPVRGIEPRLRECLASFCRQSYKNYELIFAVQDAADPAIALIEQLIRDYPDRDIRLVVNPARIGLSAKLCNLENALRAAKHQLLVISDSDILVEPDYLKKVVAPFADQKVGLVTCLYRAAHTDRLASLLEAIGISAEFLPGVFAALRLEGLRFALGATIAIRREVLEQIGGFGRIADYLGDDYLLGKLTSEAGYELVFCDSVVETVLPDYTLEEFVAHQLRWARNLKASRPGGYLGLLFTHTTVFVIAGLLFYPDSGWLLLASMLGLCLRFYSAWVIGVKNLQDQNLAEYFHLVPLRDLVWFVIWLLGFWGNKVTWRGQSFRVSKGGRLMPV
ncbi:MAG: bacteriohopanetetrol glucosamine biosynthesis glycosyltransferase HpnI [Acidobacteriota bacterium]|nr:bacteriohopanetetrol glucosamine biosynthesis glycosyltransferase HpnI [Blastocatellia bacterium]MDW8413276.1 bacteriohopanetetrol glucosamine biosynthesis glycosyltransferase HpnI [Acidobacteriota bacterium]